ncbi:hypothetical protein N9Z08_00200 [Pirellulales bacterium]|nr:hypothetical protein [Pirellulales bacterium]
MKKPSPQMIKMVALNLLIAIVFASVGYFYGRSSAWHEFGEQVPHLPDIRRLVRENQALLREAENSSRFLMEKKKLLEENQALQRELESMKSRQKPNRSKPTDREIYNYAESQFKRLDSKTEYKRATALNDFDAIDRMEEKVLRDIASHFGISEMEVQQARVRGSRR